MFLFIVAALSVGFAVASRRRVAPEEWRLNLLVQISEGSALRYLQEVVESPAEVAWQIRKRNRLRARRLQRGKLRGRMDLYACLADLISVVEGKEVTANAARLRLGRLLDRNRWDWPEGDDPIEAWRAHFEEHPLG